MLTPEKSGGFTSFLDLPPTQAVSFSISLIHHHRFFKHWPPSWSEQLASRYYVRATEKLADDEEAETLFVAFSEFEERCKEPERARFIYKFALDHIPTGRAADLYKSFVAFYKQYGDKDGMPLLGRGGFSMKMK
ncbi:Uncharacterized protein Rs2_03636 [Raphanus sativus]|nr:Uncharacterized protein Rs2_03636 [Raphanus sativus]